MTQHNEWRSIFMNVFDSEPKYHFDVQNTPMKY